MTTSAIFAASATGATRSPSFSALAQLVERLQLPLLAGRLDGERLGRHVDDLGPEDVGRSHDLGPVLRLGIDANQHQLTLDVVVVGQVADLDDVDQLVELLHDLLDDELVAVDDDGHPGDGGIERLSHRQALDVVTAGREESGHARQDAELVLDEDGDRVLAGLAPVLHQKPVCDRAAFSRVAVVGFSRIMSVLAPPAGTIGNTYSHLSTHMSTTTGPGVANAFSSVGITSDGRVARRPTQP